MGTVILGIAVVLVPALVGAHDPDGDATCTLTACADAEALLQCGVPCAWTAAGDHWIIGDPGDFFEDDPLNDNPFLDLQGKLYVDDVYVAECHVFLEDPLLPPPPEYSCVTGHSFNEPFPGCHYFRAHTNVIYHSGLRHQSQNVETVCP